MAESHPGEQVGQMGESSQRPPGVGCCRGITTLASEGELPSFPQPAAFVVQISPLQ